ncbi:MAG: flagellar hook-basal body complex protein [Moraxellaceae bacterium]|nr:MAG: flagellar hook-basal body complex protein [Moraxellaceae bacterium]
MSFNTALSGIRAADTDLKVTGNNIANAGTIGFKASRAEFGDVYTSSLLGGGSTTAGSGVTTLALRQGFDQGNLKFTQNAMDMAVNGSGFFVLSQGGNQTYTRAGAFGLDKEGNVVASNGANLRGFAADANGNVSGILGNLKVDVNTQAPRQTTGVDASFNLNANEKVLKTVGSSFVTDGAAIGVSQTGLKTATTTATPVGAVATPINFVTTPTTFNITLAGSSPATGNGTVAVTLNSSAANSLQDVANLINSSIYSAPTPVNVQAIVNGSNLELRDLTTGVGSTITVGGVTGANALSTALSGAPASNPGVAATTNGYQAQTLVIQGPTGDPVNFTSVAGDSAAKTASSLNSLSGVSATATTSATVTGATFNNANGNLVLNGVTLTSNTLAGLENEINGLTSSKLPGVSATVNPAGDLQLTSAVGTDLNFSFASPSAAGNLDVLGRTGTGVQNLSSINNAVIVGGDIKVVMESGFSIASSTPTVGNLFAPLTAASFTEVPINAFDPDDQKSYNHATSSTVYDSLGNSHVMRSYFVKENYDVSDPTTSPNHWSMYVQIDGQNVGDPDPTLPSPQNTLPTMAKYNVHFNPDGSLDTSLTDTMLISNWTPIGSDGQPLGALTPLNVLQGGTTPVAEPASSSNFVVDLGGSTQFGSVFSVENLDQNGYTTGRLAGLDVDSSGILFARFTNGEAQTLGQVALANFNNIQGLKPVGDTMWAQTFETGEAIIGAPGSASLGDIKSGALEESNVDLSEQLVNLIIAQRNYQANAKTIETANATTQTIINLR